MSEVEITLHDAPLRNAMIDHGQRILWISGAISLATAALLFFAVQRLIVRPIARVVDHMTAYRDDPEDVSRIIAPVSGARELREAETALQELQLRLTAALRQKERLASLGGAVAKVSHDLRNMLTTAQLLADRLEASDDPGVRRTAPKLVALAGPRDQPLRADADLRQGRGAAARADELRAGAAGRRGARERAPGGRGRVDFARRCPTGSPCAPTPTSCSGSCRTSCATPPRRSRPPAGPGAVTVSAAEAEGRRDPGRRHRPRPAAEGARQPVPAVPRRRPPGRRRARARHRRRARPRPRRHAGARGDRPEGLDLPHRAARPAPRLSATRPRPPRAPARAA